MFRKCPTVNDSSCRHQVTVVGIVRTVKESATRLDYELDDMTGPLLEVRQFVDNDVSCLCLVLQVLWPCDRVMRYTLILCV